MTRNIFLANRIREVFLSGHWIANTNYKEQLLSITWEEAIRKMDGLNTIAALTFHINYYVAGVLNVFINGKLEIRDKYSFDLPPIQSESDWKQLVDAFLHNSEAFALQVEQMTETQLEETFVDEKYGNYLRNIEGIIEHGYYHLGQISLLKKMIVKNRSTQN